MFCTSFQWGASPLMQLWKRWKLVFRLLRIESLKKSRIYVLKAFGIAHFHHIYLTDVVYLDTPDHSLYQLNCVCFCTFLPSSSLHYFVHLLCVCYYMDSIMGALYVSLDVYPLSIKKTSWNSWSMIWLEIKVLYTVASFPGLFYLYIPVTFVLRIIIQACIFLGEISGNI